MQATPASDAGVGDIKRAGGVGHRPFEKIGFHQGNVF